MTKYITRDEYEGQPLLVDYSYYEDLDDLEVNYDPEDLPETATVCRPIPFFPEDGLKTYLDGTYIFDDFGDLIKPSRLTGVEDLMDAWRKFAELNKNEVYFRDTNTELKLK